MIKQRVQKALVAGIFIFNLIPAYGLSCEDSLADSYIIAVEYLSGKNRKKNIKKSIELLNRLAKEKNKKALFLLGALYLEGRHLKQNNQKAYSLIKLSSELNFHRGLYQMGIFHMQGLKKIVKIDYKKARQFFNQAQKEGSSESTYALQLMNISGLGL